MSSSLFVIWQGYMDLFRHASVVMHQIPLHTDTLSGVCGFSNRCRKYLSLWSSVCLFYLAPNCFTSHWPVLFCWLPGFLPWLMFVVWGEQGYEQNEETFVQSHVLQLSVYVSGVNSERVSSSIIHTNILEVLKHDPWQTHHCPPVNILVFGWSVCGLVCKILLLVSAIIWLVDYWNFVSLILHNPLFPLFHSFSSY